MSQQASHSGGAILAQACQAGSRAQLIAYK